MKVTRGTAASWPSVTTIARAAISLACSRPTAQRPIAARPTARVLFVRRAATVALCRSYSLRAARRPHRRCVHASTTSTESTWARCRLPSNLPGLIVPALACQTPSHASSKTREALRQTREALRQTREALRRTREALRQTREALRRTREALRRTREALRRTREALPRTRELLPRTRAETRHWRLRRRRLGRVRGYLTLPQISWPSCTGAPEPKAPQGPIGRRWRRWVDRGRPWRASPKGVHREYLRPARRFDVGDPAGGVANIVATAARAIARRLVAQFARLVSISSNDEQPLYYC